MKSFTQDMTLSPETLAEARGWVAAHVKECAVRHQVDLSSAEFAVGEILQNIIRYAYEGAGPITLRVTDLDEAVGITVFDKASPSEPDTWVTDKPSVDGGLGLSVVKNAVDAYSFRPLLSGNRASIYFFPGQPGFEEAPLRWAGELLEARASGETIQNWIDICASGGLVESRIIEALKICNDALISHEQNQATIPRYHNTAHFLDVFISTMHWLESQQDESVPAGELLITALMHDYRHPGQLKYLERVGRSVESVSAELFQELFLGKSLLCADEIELVSQLILDTEPGPLTRSSTQWSQLFNAFDVSASMIPWFGTRLTQRLIEEQKLSVNAESLYPSFLKSRSGQQIPQIGELFNPWYFYALGRVVERLL